MSNFICPHCGMTNIDCEEQGYKTPKEIELQQENEKLKQKLEQIKGVIENSCVTIQIELCTRTHCYACNRLASGETVEKIKEIIEENKNE